MSRQRILLLIAIAGIIVYTTAVFILPLKNRVIQNQQVIASLTREVELIGLTPEEKGQLNREVQDLRARVEKLNRMVPRETGNAEVILILSYLAEKHNLHQSHISESQDGKVSPEKPNLETRFSVNKFLWKGSGYYEDVKGFIKALEKSERLMEINDIKLLKKSEAESVTAGGKVYEGADPFPVAEPQIIVSFQLKTYHEPLDPGVRPPTSLNEIREDTKGKSNPFR